MRHESKFDPATTDFHMRAGMKLRSDAVHAMFHRLGSFLYRRK